MASKGDAVYKVLPMKLLDEFMKFVIGLINSVKVPDELHRSIKLQLLENVYSEQNFDTTNFDTTNSTRALELTEHFNENFEALLNHALDEFLDKVSNHPASDRLAKVEKLRRTVERRREQDSRYECILPKLQTELDSILLQTGSISSRHSEGAIGSEGPPTLDRNNVAAPSLESYLGKEKAEYILKMLENIGLTSNGKSILGPREKSGLLGVVQALMDKSFIPGRSLHKTVQVIANEIGMPLDVKLGNGSKVGERFKKLSLKYLHDSPFRQFP